MSASENALRGEVIELKEKIASIEQEIMQLQKRRKAYIAKMRLMENHLDPDGYHGDGENQAVGSSDESFTTTELLELSLSSISSSVLGSNASLHSDEEIDSESHAQAVECGEGARYNHKWGQKTGKKEK